MAKRVEGVTEKLLESAKNEFLKNGYENASLQVIAEKAGSSKGAIYIRYPDKKSLYCALVEPTADEFCKLHEGELHRFQLIPIDEQKDKVMTFGNDGFSKVIAYIYDHFDEFKLILTSGENSTYQEFIHRIIDLDISCTMQFIEQTGNDALSSGRLTPELAHIQSRAYSDGLFEVLIHVMHQDQAVEHIQRMRRFYNAGWKTIFEGNVG